MKHFNKRGFTLIELLVVIFIIGALSAMLLPNFMSSRERARDAQRKNDLKQIQTGLEMYKLDQLTPAYIGTLPTVGDCWTSQGTGDPCPAGNVYMKKFPQDPMGTATVTKPYYYEINPGGLTDNLTYDLCACLENEADPEAIAGNCEDTDYICTKGVKYVLDEP